MLTTDKCLAKRSRLPGGAIADGVPATWLPVPLSVALLLLLLLELGSKELVAAGAVSDLALLAVLPLLLLLVVGLPALYNCC